MKKEVKKKDCDNIIFDLNFYNLQVHYFQMIWSVKISNFGKMLLQWMLPLTNLAADTKI